MPRKREQGRRRLLLDVRAYLKDKNVLRMSLAERGAYSTLLLELWDLEEPGVVEAHDRVLMTLARCSGEEWEAVRGAVELCFDTDSRPGWWLQQRMIEENRADNRRFKLSQERKRRAANTRWGNKKDAPRMYLDAAESVPGNAKTEDVGRKTYDVRRKTEEEAEAGRRASGISGKTWTTAGQLYPGVDLETVEAKVVASWEGKPGPGSISQRFIGWCSHAKAQGIDQRTEAPQGNGTDMSKLRQLLAEKENAAT